MIIIFVQDTTLSVALLQSVAKLSKQLKKQWGILCFADNADLVTVYENHYSKFLEQNGFTNISVFVKQAHPEQLAEFCEQLEASFLFFQLNNVTFRHLRQSLTFCRDLRIPYLFFKNSFSVLNLDKVVVPVGFLEEEIEKAQFVSAFGRFCGSEIMLLPANDYGSKAATTTDKMKTILDKFQLTYTVEKAQSDSFKIDREAIEKAVKIGADLVIISASREYGLDDILFGPKELHLIKKSPVPILLVNPRSDLYALCD
jgi:nucleotide-binding universal stress UspA family protein